MRAFVCKSEFYEYHEADFNEIDLALGTPVPCEEGWSLFGHHCNKVFTSNELTYHEAENDCNMRGGHLGSIHSNGFNRFIKQLFTETLSESRGFWIGVSYTNWDDGKP